VQVLEPDGERRDAATLAQEIDQQAARAQSDQHAVQPGEAPGRRREADKVHQQPDVLGTREANKSQAVFELAHGFRLAVGGIDPEDTANDHVRGNEQEHDRLEDVDDLDGDLGPDLHQTGPGAHPPEQQGGEHDPDRMRLTEQGDGDRVEADARAIGRVHEVGDADDLTNPRTAERGGDRVRPL